MTALHIDRRSRFRIARLLWDSCSAAVTPADVLLIAARVEEQLVVRDDTLELVKSEVEAAGVPPDLVPKVASLVLMTLNDRADRELAQLKGRR
jgi:hypothetical protein